MPARRKLTDADRVWNRACYREGTDLREGDLALAALIRVDGYIQNGGVGHAFISRQRNWRRASKAMSFLGFTN